MSDVLTIGMATRGEFDSVYFTLSGLAANHPRVQYLVVDNTPERCPRTESITRAVGGTYLHRPDLTGTSKPRDAVFRFAKTPWVMCIDSHVIFETDFTGGQPVSSIQRLLDWIAANPESRDMIQGPMIADDGVNTFSHWTQPKPPGLWGEWEAAYTAEKFPRPFTVKAEDQRLILRDVMTGEKFGSYTPVDNPAKHYGWRRLPVETPPFEIPMLGLGCWAMRKEAWPGFNFLFRGFGGEEGYIHQTVRNRGGKTLLLPFLRWRHKFRDVGGFDKNPVPYPLTLEDHVWNLLVGHRELGLKAESQIYEDFGKRLPPQTWEILVNAAATAQPFGGPRSEPPQQTLLAVWYTDNTAPPDLLAKSLATLKTAQAGTWRHRVKVITVGWEPIPGNPFPFIRYDTKDGSPRRRSHATLISQIRAGMDTQAGALEAPAAVVCCEHDVLYPADYFNRVGDALALNPNAPVVSNLDYIGLNATGWLAVKERHEPMHQLAIRWKVMEENLERAARECAKSGSAIVEPDHDQPRKNWARIQPSGLMPSVHVNHTAGRYTSHGEVCYAAHSNGTTRHVYWGEAKNWWPGGAMAPVPAPVAVTFQNTGGCSACEGNKYDTLDKWYEAAKVKPSDFNEHVATLKELCDGLESVAEISGWNKPAVLAMAASSAKRVMSYAPRAKVDWARLKQLAGDRFNFAEGDRLPAGEICDLLFLDTAHTAQTVYDQLTQNAAAVRRYFVVHTTDIYGETGDDGTPGVLAGVRRFVLENKEWTTIRHDRNNFGLIVLSRDDRDKKQPPGKIRQALSFGLALVKHAVNMGEKVPEEVFHARLELCVMCPERFHDVCGACGCPINDKAAWASEECGRVKLNDPAKPVLWHRYNGPDSPGVEVIPTAEPADDLKPVVIGYDMDGVLSTGKFKPEIPFVVISGRLESEREATMAELAKLGLSPVAVFLRTEGAYGDGIASGQHKAATIKRLGIEVFYEDNPDHVVAVKTMNPNCSVVMVGN